MDQDRIIVCYMGGMFGDLIVGTIDSSDAKFKNSRIEHNINRTKLKKPHNFASINKKDDYLIEIFTQYKSIPSHDLDYHINRKHRFLGIVVSDKNTALKAATRFQQLHAPHVWEEMQKKCGANTTTDYAERMIDYSWLVRQHTDLTLSLEDIYNCTATETLKKLGLEINDREKKFYTDGLGYVLNRVFV